MNIYLDRHMIFRSGLQLQYFLEQFRYSRKKTTGVKKTVLTKYCIQNYKVCQIHLCKLLQISARELVNPLKKKKLQMLTIKKVKGRPKNKQQEIDLEAFFNSLQKEKSHYNTKNTQLFIMQFTEISELFREYVRFSVRTFEIAKYDKFRLYFHHQIETKGIRLGQLKTDCCDECLSLKMKCQHSNGKTKIEIEEKLKKHHEEANREQKLQTELNSSIHFLNLIPELKGTVFRRDADPASNCYYPNQQKLIGSEQLQSTTIS